MVYSSIAFLNIWTELYIYRFDNAPAIKSPYRVIETFYQSYCYEFVAVF